MSDQRLEIVLAAKDVSKAALKRFQGKIKEATKSIFSLKTGIAALAGGVGLQQMASGFLDTAKAFEKYETQLKTITGTSASAKASMSWITEFTSKTPYELNQVTESFVKLKAYGMDATRWMDTLGDTSAAMGKDLNQAVEMFADAATGEFERLKEFGVRASQEGDNVTFRWSQNGQDMVKSAEKTQTGITQALGDIFTRFDGSMDDLSNTWEGMMSNLSDKWTMFQKDVADSGPFQAMKTGLRELLDYLETNEGKMNLEKWAQKTAVAVLEAFKLMTASVNVFVKSIAGVRVVFASLMKFNAENTINSAQSMIDNLERQLKRFSNTSNGVLTVQIKETHKAKASIAKYKEEIENATMTVQAANAMISDNVDVIMASDESYAKVKERIDAWIAASNTGGKTSKKTGDDVKSGADVAIKAIKATEKAIKAATTAAKEMSNDLDAVYLGSLGGIDRQIEEANRKYLDMAATVEKYFDLGEISVEQRKALLDGINKNWDAAVESARKSTEKMAEDTTSIFDEMWDDVSNMSIENWKDMWGSFEAIVRKAVFSIGQELVFKPIIQPVIQGAAASLGLGGATGSAGGAGGLLSTAGAAASLGKYVPGTAGITAGISNFMSTPVFGGSGPVMGPPIPGHGYSMVAPTWGATLGAAGIGALGYSTVGDWVGLPQGMSASIGSGLGAGAGYIAGTALAPAATAAAMAGGGFSGTSLALFGAYGGPIGIALGAIAGGLLGDAIGDLFNDSKDFRVGPYRNLDFDMWEMPNLGSRADDEAQWGSGNWNIEPQDIVRRTVVGTTEAVYDQVDDYLELLPDEMASAIRSDLSGVDITLPFEGRMFDSNDEHKFRRDIEALVTDTQTLIWDAIEPTIIENISTYTAGQIPQYTETLGMLQEDHPLARALKNENVFNADYTMAEGADIETYVGAVNSVITGIGQVDATWSNFTGEVDLGIEPLTRYQTELKNVTDRGEAWIQTLTALGFSQEKINEAQTEWESVITATNQRYADNIDKDLTNRLNKMTLSDEDYQIWQANEWLTETLADIDDMGDGYGYLADKATAVFDAMVDGINDTTDAVEDATEAARAWRQVLKDAQMGIAQSMYTAGLSTIGSIQEDIAFKQSGMSRSEWLLTRLESYSQQYTAGDTTLADWERAMATVGEWYTEATSQQERTAQAWTTAADTAEAMSKSISSARESLMMGALNVALPSVKYSEAQSLYASKLSGAISGDQSAIQEFLSFAPAYLEAASENYKSSPEYQAIYTSVIGSMDSLQAMVDAPDYTRKLFEQAKQDTQILRSIDQGILDLAQQFTVSIQNVINDTTAANGFDIASIDKITQRYAAYDFKPSYEHSIINDQWLQNYNDNSPRVLKLAETVGVSGAQVMADLRALAAWYDYVEAQRREGIMTPYSPAGYADGGISYEPQLAWVSEGQYPVEAHVPLPDGRRIPVEMRGAHHQDSRQDHRPLNITIVVGGEEFDARIESIADNIRVKAERRGMGAVRITS